MLDAYLKQSQTTTGATVALCIVGAVLGVIAWPALPPRRRAMPT
jgi:hypothetical protein